MKPSRARATDDRPTVRLTNFHRLALVVCAVGLGGGALVDAVSVSQRPVFAPPETPLFAGGKDVFGRPPRCRTCHLVVNNLNQRLVPGRGLDSSTFQLNLSALYGIGGARRGCVARVKEASGGV